MNGFQLFARLAPGTGIDCTGPALDSRLFCRAAGVPATNDSHFAYGARPRTWLLALAWLAAFVATPCLADVYKWVDKNGVAHYADQPPPPPQMDVQTLKDTHSSTGAAPGTVAPAGDRSSAAVPAASSGPATAAATAAPAPNTVAPQPTAAKGAAPAKPQSFADKELEFRKRRLETAEAKEKQAKADAAALKKEENCRQQRSRVTTIREGGRLVRYDDKGERVDLSDADRESELRSALQSMEAACK